MFGKFCSSAREGAVNEPNGYTQSFPAMVTSTWLTLPVQY